MRRSPLASVAEMTYNFDADKWYERQRNVLDVRLAKGEIDQAQFERELEELDQRYDEMTSRLDGTFQLPPRD